MKLFPTRFADPKSAHRPAALLVFLPVLLLVFLLTAVASAASGKTIHHRLAVEIDPASGGLTVIDRVTLPAEKEEDEEEPVDFLLNAALELRSSQPAVDAIPLGDVSPFFSLNAGAPPEELELRRYRLPPGTTEVTLVYDGSFDFGLGDSKEEYTRGFRETLGIVSEDGLYLAGSGFWVPRFDDGLVSFELEAVLPDGWHAISQGEGSSRDAKGHARWRSAEAMDEIYLVGGPLVVYRDTAGAVQTLVYLRRKEGAEDDGLAAKYLATGAQYLEMYRELLGPYPYAKFAVVENFWETGYGMPSFTLLGPTVIRFPFILHSSYPHEILHNWWGNSVFVDYGTGNWSEGLTAYLADHLVQEQRGKGAEHRRGVLQKYRDYVKDGRDFPLAEFRSRHSAATEAVGYGKTLMGFHSLRRRLGDESFLRALQRFYRKHRGERAAFADLRRVFEEASGEDLGTFFHEWVERPGAAALDVEVEVEVEVEGIDETSSGFTVRGRIVETQKGDPFTLDVPLRIQAEDGIETATVRLGGRSTAFEIETASRPLALHVDPDFDVFRQLDPRETPPSIGQLFGEPEILALLPAAAPEAERARYRELMDAWQSASHEIDVRLDRDVERLPEDRGVWILGRENRHAERFGDEPALGVVLEAEGVQVRGEKIPFAGHSLVWIARHSANVEKAVGWLVVEPAAAFPGMARKLPHYGKYSYLGFAGDEPTNVVKGQWPTADSPLSVDLRPASERGEALAPLEPDERDALAELPPVFSQKALLEHVAWLAAPEREGRGVGTQGLAATASYVARAFEAAGLEPAGDKGTYFQRLQVEGPDGEKIEVANVLAKIPGRRDDWAGQSAILSAHLDHLGRGWPDVRQGEEGKIHPGADDNASGIAVLLEMAKVLAASEAPGRTLLFAAFTAEEAGRAGSRYFVDHPLRSSEPLPLEKVMGVINLDTVGRLGSGRVSVLGTGTADEWQHIFRGASFVTGVESKNVPGSAEGSDQWSFIERGVPGVQIFTGPHEDYHRPGDVAAKVDGPGLVKIATFVKEGIVYLGEREEPLTVTIEGVEPAGQDTPPPPRTGRRVSFGSVPDFAFAGPGVKLSGVTQGSPAAKAGLREGDVLLALDGKDLPDLRAFSNTLKTLEPGQTVRATILRDGKEMIVDVTVAAR